MDQPQGVTLADLTGKKSFREGAFDRASAKTEARTVELAFSSEAPYERWFGIEVLSHDTKSVNLERVASGRANVLINHDPGDWVAVIESARIDSDRVGRAVVRFGNSARAQEVFKDVQDGILTSVSVGYIPEDMALTREVKDGPNEYTVTRWTPFEVSLVTVPADASVGVGRAKEQEPEVHQPAKATTKGVQKMDDVKTVERSADIVVTSNQQNAETRNPVELERARRSGIENLCKANKIDDRARDYWITSGTSMERVAEEMLQIMEERGRENPKPASALGLTNKETQTFSIMRAIRAVADQNWNAAGFEAECSRALQQKLGIQSDPKKFLVPYEVQQRQNQTPVEQLAYQLAKRDLSVAASGGNFLVETTNVGFVDLLRARSVLFNMGARRLSGLQGNVAIPKQSAAATAVWLANETSTITESQPTVVQLSLSPKTVGGYTEISRQLLLQSNPSAEGLVVADLAATVALDIDLKGLNGTGASGQPTGILNTAGIGSVTGTTMDYADIIEFQTDVFASNVSLGECGFVTTGAVAGLFKQRVKFASTASPIWEGRLDEGVVDGPSGYRGMATNQMPAATMLFGAFSQVIVAEWGVLELEVNPYANFQAGIIGVRAMASVDIAVRYGSAFSAAATIT